MLIRQDKRMRHWFLSVSWWDWVSLSLYQQSTVDLPLIILVSFPCQIALITWNSFGEEAGNGCKWINKCSNTKCLITVLTLNYRGKLLATSVWGVTHHGAETCWLSIWCVSYHPAYQQWFNNVLGVSLRADLDPWINYHSSTHKPRSHFLCHAR